VFQVKQLLGELLGDERYAERAQRLADQTIRPSVPLDHGLMYAQSDDTSAFDFLVRAPYSTQLAPGSFGFLGLLRGFRERQWPVAIDDLTTPDVAAAGWRCARASCPVLTPLYFGTSPPPALHARLSSLGLLELTPQRAHPLA
jgi:hypothetical protein